MNSKKKVTMFILLVIAALCFTLIALGQQKDSIKFSIEESRALVDAHNALLGFLTINDSLKAEIKISKNETKECLVLNKEFKQQKEEYKELSLKTETMLREQEKKLARSEKWRIMWRKITLGLALSTGTLITYEAIKR